MALPQLEPVYWYVFAASIVVAFLLGYIYGRSGNKSRPLNRIAKSLTAIEKKMGRE